MKLFFIGILTLFSAALFQGCEQKSPDSRKAATPKKTPTFVCKKPTAISCKNCRTLNGVDQETAIKMMTAFCNFKDNDTKPLPTSVWFSKEIIHSIDSLLHAEIAVQLQAIPNRKDTTDGIRIYFACDTAPGNNYPLNTSILLVSTKYDLKPKTDQSSHRDYYDHDAKFLTAPFGKVSHDSNEAGARLYHTLYLCLSKNPPCIVSPDHIITCKQAHNWVNNHVQNKNHIAINTLSEWFDLTFFDTLDHELYKKKRPDGVRIYFAFRDHDADHPSLDNRHVFVLMTTKKAGKNHRDYFNCEVESYPWGGDNGELCPTYCN